MNHCTSTSGGTSASDALLLTLNLTLHGLVEHLDLNMIDMLQSPLCKTMTECHGCRMQFVACRPPCCSTRRSSSWPSCRTTAPRGLAQGPPVTRSRLFLVERSGPRRSRTCRRVVAPHAHVAIVSHRWPTPSTDRWHHHSMDKAPLLHGLAREGTNDAEGLLNAADDV